MWDEGVLILPPYNKTVSHERAASASTTEGGPNNGPEYPEEASALRVTRTALSPRGAEGVDGGAMHAIYQHRTDNEVPRRLPVVVDDDGDDRAANLSRSPHELSETSYRNLVSGIPAEDSGRWKSNERASPRNARHIA